MAKERKTVLCRGRLPSGRKCEKPIYDSDGQYLFILDFVVNPDFEVQKIVCPNCGYRMTWKRNDEFIKEEKTAKKKFRQNTR